jgi:hypothetical protein
MLSKLVADAADKLLKKDKAEAQAQKNAQAQNDPIIQLQKAEMETKKAEVQRKGMADKLRAMLGKEQIASKEKLEGTKLGMNVRSDMIDKEIELKRLEVELARIKSQEKQAGARLGVDVAQGIAGDQIERDRIAGQNAQAEMREGVNVQRNEQSAELERERLANERTRDQQNTAKGFMGMFRSNTKDVQKPNKDEENT